MNYDALLKRKVELTFQMFCVRNSGCAVENFFKFECIKLQCRDSV